MHKRTTKRQGPTIVQYCTAKLVKWLDQDNRGKLLDIYNNILDSDVYPESLKLANIVSIFKKRDATKMQNYRPIALLQVLYKLFAAICCDD